MNDADVKDEGQEAGSLYPEGAVTGSAEDALKGHEDVEIKSTNTEKIEVKSESEPEPEKEDKETEGQAEDKASDADKKDDTPAPENEFKKAADASEDLKADLTKKGVDWEKLTDEFYDNGGLSDASYDALTKAGYPKTVVDAYLAGVEATADKFVADVLDHVGGKDNYDQLTRFIQTQGKAAVDSFNALIDKGDVNGVKLALDGYRARMRNSRGYSGRSILGNSTGRGNPGESAGYASRQEMVKAMSDPRYGRDRAYTESVQKKTINSNFMG